MTLHDTTELAKKGAIGTGIGIVAAIVLFIFVRIGMFVWSIVFPPKIEPPKMTYDVLPALKFPENVVSGNFTYTLNTSTGTLPTFPDRLVVFPLPHNSPNFLNLENIKKKVEKLGFLSPLGGVVPEIHLGGPLYEWDDPSGVNRKLTFNIVTFDFTMTSNYLASLTVLGAQNLSDETTAIGTTEDFLRDIQLFPDDIDLDKTKTRHPDQNYVTYPQLFSIQNGTLVSTTSLSKAQVIRVELYQKDIEYDLNTGRVGDLPHMKLPIVYPNPPYSTMSFWIASGQNDPEVMQSEFTHQSIDQTDIEATYPIISAEQAFENLKQGKAYIASHFDPNSSDILINNVYLAYYMGKDQQDYLMPVIVFEGSNGFMAYVSAVSDEWVK
jgi:hypothetical protein